MKINKNVEETFKQRIGETKGTFKGNLKTSIEEALFMWMQAYKKGYKTGFIDTMQKELEELRGLKKNEYKC